MKKAFTHIFVVLSNFYILTYFVGLILMTGTLLTGSMKPSTGIFAMLFSLGLSISYQLIRHHLNYQSFGEQLIQSTDKK